MTESFWVISILCAYLVGSIPFGVLLSNTKGVNIQEHGSKNIGATNVGRVLGKKLGLVCLALDALKGAVPVYVVGSMAGLVGQPLVAYSLNSLLLWIVVAIAPLIGHMYSVFLKLRGGKGVATTLGSMLGMWPILTVPILVTCACFVLTLALFRIVSLSSVLAAISLPIATYFSLAVQGSSIQVSWPVVAMTGFITILVIWKHRDNLNRIARGEEPRMNA